VKRQLLDVLNMVEERTLQLEILKRRWLADILGKMAMELTFENIYQPLPRSPCVRDVLTMFQDANRCLMCSCLCVRVCI